MGIQEDFSQLFTDLGAIMSAGNTTLLDNLQSSVNTLQTSVNTISYLLNAMVQHQAPTPTVTSVSPLGGPLSGGTSVVITGTGLTGVTAVNFYPWAGENPSQVLAASFTIDSDTQITAVSPVVSTGEGAFVDVVVTNWWSSSSVITPADQFVYYPGTPTAPTVTSVVPSTASAGDTVTINGTGFGGGGGGLLNVNVHSPAPIYFGPNPVTSQAWQTSGPGGDTQITGVVVPPGTGVVDVTVSTYAGTSPTSSVDQFTYE